MKFNPIVAAYLVALGAGVYFVKKFFDEYSNLTDKAAAAANKYAEQGGEQGAMAATMPGVLYAKARSDYAASILFDLSTGLEPPNWPSEDDWLNHGAGPAGFTYGSANYPKPEGASTAQTVINWLADHV